jgi:anti-sigma regulatory factor (Ser/Thr protein kinase)
VRCESLRGATRTCPVPWNGRSRLARQLSDTPCREGSNWQSQRGAVMVYGGCRGEFAHARDAGPPVGDYQVTCSSKDGRYTTCAWDRSNGRPRLLQQISSSPCIENRSWGYSRQQGLWVTSGCRGRFGGRR